MSSSTDENTILLVDDDTNLLKGLADLLRLNRYRVITATNGKHALDSMLECVPDLIISDISMPVMDGYQFYEAVRGNADWTLIPFIFLTARDQEADIHRGIGLGVEQYMVKPIDPKYLLIAVKARLERFQGIQEAALDDVERMQQQFLNVFSHELRTPLTYIYGYVNLLQEEHANLEDDRVDDMLARMRSGTERLVDLIRSLMLVVYIDSGAVALEIARHSIPVELARLLRETIRELRARAETHHVTIRTDIADGLTVYGMPLYLQEIMRQLVENGIKFSRPKGGRVWVCAQEQDGYAVITVRDDGIGIEPAKQRLLFRRFQQIDRPKREQQGIGLGLTIAHDLAVLHGGDIQVESIPGRGSTFTVTLPCDGGGD